MFLVISAVCFLFSLCGGFSLKGLRYVCASGSTEVQGLWMYPLTRFFPSQFLMHLLREADSRFAHFFVEQERLFSCWN